MSMINETNDELTFIQRDEEGRYHWTYFVNSESNKSFLKLYMRIFALVILIPGVIMFFVIYGRDIETGYWSGAGPYLGILLAIFLGVELLTFLIYTLFEKLQGGVTPIPYLMDEKWIIVHPGSELAPQSHLQTFFSDVKSVGLDLSSDLILLNEPIRVTHVYVPEEDLPFVLNFILDRMAQNERTERLRLELNAKLAKRG